MHHPKPLLLVSRCFEFAPCRYDGTAIPAGFVACLAPFVEVVTVCPELSIGLGVPRPTIRQERAGDAVHLVQPSSGRDLSEAMRLFAERFFDELGAPDGTWLKARSPSCATRDGKLYDPASGALLSQRSAGRFASVALARYPHLPTCDDRRANHVSSRDHFLAALFARTRFRLAAAEGTRSALMAFHADHKYLLMAHGQDAMRELGRIAATEPGETLVARYRAGLEPLLATKPTRGSMVNAATHILGYFRDVSTPAERAAVAELFERYRRRPGLVFALRARLRSLLARNQEPYIERQAFLEPYPLELEVRTSLNRRR